MRSAFWIGLKVTKQSNKKKCAANELISFNKISMTVVNRHHEEMISVFGAFKDARQQHTLHATTAIGWKKRRQQK